MNHPAAGHRGPCCPAWRPASPPAAPAASICAAARRTTSHRATAGAAARRGTSTRRRAEYAPLQTTATQPQRGAAEAAKYAFDAALASLAKPARGAALRRGDLRWGIDGQLLFGGCELNALRPTASRTAPLARQLAAVLISLFSSRWPTSPPLRATSRRTLDAPATWRDYATACARGN